MRTGAKLSGRIRPNLKQSNPAALLPATSIPAHCDNPSLHILVLTSTRWINHALHAIRDWEFYALEWSKHWTTAHHSTSDWIQGENYKGNHNNHVEVNRLLKKYYGKSYCVFSYHNAFFFGLKSCFTKFSCFWWWGIHEGGALRMCSEFANFANFSLMGT